MSFMDSDWEMDPPVEVKVSDENDHFSESLIKEISGKEILSMTPLQALQQISDWQNKIKSGAKLEASTLNPSVC